VAFPHPSGTPVGERRYVDTFWIAIYELDRDVARPQTLAVEAAQADADAIGTGRVVAMYGNVRSEPIVLVWDSTVTAPLEVRLLPRDAMSVG
jgi:hypothetical protein